MVTGRLDLLIFTPQFWVLAIEAKGTQYSLDAGIPQVLSYMLGNPEPEKPAFGFVTNGIDFMFLKLERRDRPQYGESYPFSMRRGDDLQTVLRILKHLRQLAGQSNCS